MTDDTTALAEAVGVLEVDDDHVRFTPMNVAVALLALLASYPILVTVMVVAA